MRRTRIGLVSLATVAVLALAVAPAAAQSSAPSATAELINTLNAKLLYAAVPITILVEAILFYTVLKFRNNDEAEPTRENRRLEISWTIATALVLLFVGVASYGVMANDNVIFQGQDLDPSDDVAQEAVVVNASAYQWGWDMSYPQQNVTGLSNIVIPVDAPVYIQVKSQDVIHSFHVPKLGLKNDAMPGETNIIRTEVYEQGTYQGYCAEFCGVAHSQMTFTVEVVSQQEYQKWLRQQKSGGGGSGGSGNATSTSTATASGGSARLAAPA